MPKDHVCEEKQSTYAIKLTLSNNCKFVDSSRIVVQLKMKHDVRQPIFDKPL